MGNCHARFLGEGGASNGAPLPGTRRRRRPDHASRHVGTASACSSKAMSMAFDLRTCNRLSGVASTGPAAPISSTLRAATASNVPPYAHLQRIPRPYRPAFEPRGENASASIKVVRG